MGPDGVCAALLKRLPAGTAIGVIGGPPCQGFSRANTASHSADPSNSLVDLYVAIVTRLKADFLIEFVVFENVMGIRDRKHRAAFDRLENGLRNLGLSIRLDVYCALDHGVPQIRRRVFLTGLAGNRSLKLSIPAETRPATVHDAIGHLASPAFYSTGLKATDIPIHPNHWTSRPRSLRFCTPVNEWKPTRSFKQTFWTKPSPTIAFGHREIHVHPSGKRRLSIYEAMLLQGFPKDFVLIGNLTEQVEQVSNAVPPPLARSVAMAIRQELTGKAERHA